MIMERKKIILVEKDDEVYAFGSIKRASEMLSWIKPKSIYNLYGGSDDFIYKGARIRRLPFN